MQGHVYVIDHKVATQFLMPKHYSGRKPQISIAFGWYKHQIQGDQEPSLDGLMAVCTIGKPASPSLCVGICGAEHSSRVYELNRLCRVDDWNEPLSQFVGAVIRRVRSDDWILVSYADSGMHHNGYIYQATNFIYTGVTKERSDKYTEGNKHSPHYEKNDSTGLRKIRTAKHRYVFFCTNNKRLKKQWLACLKYPICEYPKGENRNYVLGEYQVPQVIGGEA